MPRHARFDAPGLIQHVMFRGIERREIFADDDDRDTLAALLEKILPEQVSWQTFSVPGSESFLHRTREETFKYVLVPPG